MTPIGRFVAGAILVILIIVGAVVYFFASPDKELFLKEGNIVRDNPGLVPGEWYLLYEEPGAAARSVQLSFTDESKCGSGEDYGRCPTEFTQGARVRIEGRSEESVVVVRRLTFLEPESQEKAVRLYYYNPDRDQGPGGAQCSTKGLVEVARTLPQSESIIEETIQLLLRGEISAEEKESGVTTEFPLPGVTLTDSSLDNGILTLTFSDPENKTGGGSCRVAILWHQIEATAKQFSEVREVRFLPEELFQP